VGFFVGVGGLGFRVGFWGGGFEGGEGFLRDYQVICFAVAFSPP